MKTIGVKELKDAVNLLNELLNDNQDKKEKINEVIENLKGFDSEIFESLLKFKNLKRKLLSQIELIENNSEMYSFLSKKARLFIVKDFKDRFECDFIDERVTLSEPENEIVDEIMKIFNEEKQKLELIKNISLEELKTKLNKQISKKNYKVFISDELMNIQNPNKDIMLEIKKDFENGNINLLNKRLSKASIKEDENDLLLNNWGIYHLHLGKLDNSDFSARTKLLLFIKIIDDNVYFLDIKEHGNFSSIDFTKIMHNNWEDAIKEFRTTSLVDIEPKLNEKEVYEVWKLGAIAILTFIDKKNKEVAYMPIGGGTNIAKSSIKATDKWLKLFRSLPSIDKKLNSKCFLIFDSTNKRFHIQDLNGNNLYNLDFDSL